MGKASTFLANVSESGKAFTYTIHGISVTVSDQNDKLIDQKTINLVDLDSVEEAVRALSQLLNFLNQHRDKQVDLSEPVL